jgi:pimeloyl-ACP methyl ester carboxylesterase
MVTAGYIERQAKVGDLSLSYQEWGRPDAPPVIMLHGFGVSGHMFDEFADRMQDRYRLLALDQRGHGYSAWSEAGDYTRNAFVEDLEGFRQALGIDRFILIGHSMGGLNSVVYTNRYPQHVRALVLVDVGPESAKEGVDNIVRFTRGPDELEFEEFVELAHRFNQRRTMENIRERMRHRLKPTQNGKYTWKFDKRFRQPDSGLRIGSEAGNDDSWALFRGVTAPTLLIRGAESDVLTQPIADRVATEMRKARLVVVPGAGHSVPGDAPDAFTEAVTDFLADLEAGQFEPAAAAAAVPLEQLMEEHSAASRRGSGFLVLVAAGAVAVLALAGISMAARKSRQSRNKSSVRGRVAATSKVVPALSQVDIEQARERAAEVVQRLGVVGALGTRRARQSISEVDLDRARTAAQEALSFLSEGSRNAPSAVRSAVSKVDRKKLRKRGSAAKKAGRSLAMAALSMAVRGAGKKQRKKRKIARWRS